MPLSNKEGFHVNRLFIPALALLAIWCASQSSLFSAADAEDAPRLAGARSPCPTEPTMETITLTGDFAIFTPLACSGPAAP
jgi:hypothetical protein